MAACCAILEAPQAAITLNGVSLPTCYGTEFTSNAVLDRAEKMRVTWHGIAPGRPMQTGNGEAFNERGSGRPCLADRAHAS